MSTARELLDTWRVVRDRPPVTDEPADGRPVRSILAVWRRGADGRWSSERGGADAVAFEVLARRLPLREIASHGWPDTRRGGRAR